MSNRVKLLAMDLDGTLLNSRDGVSDANRAAVREAAEAGVVPVIASGRLRQEAQFVIDAIPQLRYFIGMNGGLVEDLLTGEVLQNHPMSGETVQRLFEMLDNAGFFFQIYGMTRAYCPRHWLGRLDESGMAPAYLAMFADSIAEWSPELAAYKILAIAPTPERAVELRDILGVVPDVDIHVTNRALGYHEAVPVGVDKAHALEALCDALGVRREEVLAIGDSENDRGMLRYAGQSAAVGNAMSVVRRATRFVGPSNDLDGVAAAIRHYVFS